MVDDGAVDEVEALLARGLDPNLPVMRAIGVREIARLSARRDSTRTKRSPPASRRPAATPSGNIPGSRTSRRRTGRAFAKPLDERRDARSAGPARRERPRRAAMELLRDADIDPAPLAGKRVAILGYGNQGRAQALNLHDSGIDVVVGLRGGSGSANEAEAAGLEIALVEDAVALGRRRHAARARRNPRRALPRDRAASARRRGARLQPRPVDPLRLRSSRAPTSTCSWSRPRARARRFARSTSEGKGMIALWAVAQDATGSAREHRARLRPRDRLRARRPDRIELRRGSRSRPVQRAGGGVGRACPNC